MLGPVSSARNSLDGAATLVFMELLGILSVYGAILGEQRPRGTLRKEITVATGSAFDCVGTYLVGISTKQKRLYQLNQDSLNKAVAKLLKDFPPKPGK